MRTDANGVPGAGPSRIPSSLLSHLAVTKQEVVHPGRPGVSDGCQVVTRSRQEAWMTVHKNARLTPYRREELVARVGRGGTLRSHELPREGVAVRSRGRRSGLANSGTGRDMAPDSREAPHVCFLAVVDSKLAQSREQSGSRSCSARRSGPTSTCTSCSTCSAGTSSAG